MRPCLPRYPIKLNPPDNAPAPLASILLGTYETSDAEEAATLAAMNGWIICDVLWEERPETWVLGRLMDPD